MDLSALLREATLVPVERRKDNFRNPDGVALKLQNLRSALDPNRRLSASKTDRAVVAAYPRDRSDELSGVAASIKRSLKNHVLTDGEMVAGEEVMFIEGRILTVQHRSRDVRLRRGLLKKTADEALVCEICSFRPTAALDRELKESFFEAHHIVPLAASTGLRATRVSDLALLCAGCHRFLHKLIERKRSWITIEDARKEL
jgi:5-methylcytosine-specific restriction protein A